MVDAFCRGFNMISRIINALDYQRFSPNSRLCEMIEDNRFIDNISEEQLCMFKKYASIAPSWRKKESLACDLYFPILLALHKMGET